MCRRRCARRFADSVAYQRELAVEEDGSARAAIEAAGCEIVTLSAREHDAFVTAVQPMLKDARAEYGEEMFALLR